MGDVKTAMEFGGAVKRGEWGEAAAISFGWAFGEAVTTACVAGATVVGGPVAGAGAAAPCAVGGDAAGNFATDQTKDAWS
jgi:hypothetical protein